MSHETMSAEEKIEFQESTKFGIQRELVARLYYMKQDYTVSVPVADARYDLIAEKKGKYLRVQVKRLISKPKTWCIRPFSMAAGKKTLYRR